MALDIEKKIVAAYACRSRKLKCVLLRHLTSTSGLKTAACITDKRRRSSQNFRRKIDESYSAEFQVNVRPRARLHNKFPVNFSREISIEILAYCDTDRHAGELPDGARGPPPEISGSMKSVG
ncbi:hypothetical protein ACS0ZG_09550 [Burkholderia gladioli]|uniref:hypothetical protein n=1 Tax=Burkholderia gladioli TaxID=28095 RepID=UPI003F7AB6C5